MFDIQFCKCVLLLFESLNALSLTEVALTCIAMVKQKASNVHMPVQNRSRLNVDIKCHKYE